MAQSGSATSGVAERYANSLYDLAEESKSLVQVEKDLDDFDTMLQESADLRRLITSPVFSAEEQGRALAAVLDKAGITDLVANFLRVVARNRRLFAVPNMIKAFREIAARRRGETAADVVTAHKLTQQQETELKAALKDVAGRDVTLNVTVDSSLLGGLVVQVGSRQLDTSLKTKLNSLKLALKEVG